MGILNLPSISVNSIEEDDLDYRIKACINEPERRYCIYCFSNDPLFRIPQLIMTIFYQVLLVHDCLHQAVFTLIRVEKYD